MPIRYLLDANVLSEPMKPAPAQGVLDRLAEVLVDCATCAPVLHELEFGVARLATSRRKTLLRRYLTEAVSSLPVLPYDAAAARWHASERARLTRRGATPPFVDGQIAAIAHVQGLVLVTRNVSDFTGFLGISLESWF